MNTKNATQSQQGANAHTTYKDDLQKSNIAEKNQQVFRHTSAIIIVGRKYRHKHFGQATDIHIIVAQLVQQIVHLECLRRSTGCKLGGMLGGMLGSMLGGVLGGLLDGLLGGRI